MTTLNRTAPGIPVIQCSQFLHTTNTEFHTSKNRLTPSAVCTGSLSREQTCQWWRRNSLSQDRNSSQLRRKPVLQNRPGLAQVSGQWSNPHHHYVITSVQSTAQVTDVATSVHEVRWGEVFLEIHVFLDVALCPGMHVASGRSVRLTQFGAPTKPIRLKPSEGACPNCG